MTMFNENDVVFNRIFIENRNELVFDPPTWMGQGLVETVGGYGNRLNSGYKIHFNGRLYRVYVTIYSNIGTMWFKVKGRKIMVT